MTTKTGLRGAMAWGIAPLLLLFALPAIAQQATDPQPGRIHADQSSHDHATSVLRDRLQTDAQLSSAELAAIETELDAYADQNGDPDILAETVRAAKQEGCTGECLGETLRTMNRAMQGGMTAPAAGEMTRALVREQAHAQAGQSDEQLADRIRERANERLRNQPAAGSRAVERTETKTIERTREMRRETPPGASGGTGSGSTGSGSGY